MSSGNGGQIEISADAINVAGSLSARGGSEAGDGGGIELSATSSLSLTGNPIPAVNGNDGSVTLSAPEIDLSDAGENGQVDLTNTTGDIEIQASQRVSLSNVVEDVLDLGSSNLTINVDGISSSNTPSDAISFVMSDASDSITSTGQITIGVRDRSVNANALIDVAGRIESRPFPTPLPNDPLGPSNTISLAATNGRIRLRQTAELRAAGLGADGGSITLLATGFDVSDEAGLVFMEGSIDTSSDTGVGGSVRVLGDLVALDGAAAIQADGDTGGGEILVGGDYQGLR